MILYVPPRQAQSDHTSAPLLSIQYMQINRMLFYGQNSRLIDFSRKSFSTDEYDM